MASSGGSRDIGDFGPFYGQRASHLDSKKHRTISQLFAVVLETRGSRTRFLVIWAPYYIIYIGLAAFVQGGLMGKWIKSENVDVGVIFDPKILGKSRKIKI